MFADAHNRAVREVAADADLYALLGGPSHGVVVTLTAPAALTYGQGTVGAAVSVSGSGAAPVVLGNVVLLDGGTVVSSATLAGAVAGLPADTLGAGPHTLTVAYAGDGLHGAAVSPAVVVSVAPLPATATAAAATMSYGSFTPPLSGTLAGVLARDAAGVAANFVSSAPDLSPVGTYAIGASLSGVASGNYMLTLGPASGALQIVQAAPVVVVVAPPVAYAGLPLTVSARVGPATRGAPTGSVTFSDAGSVVGTGSVTGGVASAVYLSPGAGAHPISAAYGGDHNFLAATSSAASITVSAMPDFSVVVSGSGTQTVQGGAIASYALQVGAQPGPFSGSVSLSANGMQVGSTASFSPVAVVPGSGSAGVTMSVQTIALAERGVPTGVWLAGVVGLAVLWRRRRVMGLLALGLLVGCGDRAFPEAGLASQTFPITVTATSTNLAGTVVTHTVAVVLVVR